MKPRTPGSSHPRHRLHRHGCAARALQPLGDFVPSGIERYELADGSVVSEELFTVTVRLGKRTIPVVASLTDSKLGLIGMALIDGKRAIFNLKTHTFRVVD